MRRVRRFSRRGRWFSFSFRVECCTYSVSSVAGSSGGRFSAFAVVARTISFSSVFFSRGRKRSTGSRSFR